MKEDYFDFLAIILRKLSGQILEPNISKDPTFFVFDDALKM